MDTTVMTTIPHILHQMWISAPGRGGPTPRNLTYVKDTKTVMQSFKYTFWGRPNIATLFRDPDLMRYKSLYDQATPHICKCDIARYAVLYVHGGIYADLDVSFDRQPSDWMMSRELLLFSEYDPVHFPQTVTVDGINLIPGHIANSVMGSRPRHPFWLELLDSIASDFNISHPKSPKDVINTTGPRKLADMLVIKLSQSEDPLNSQYRPLDPLYLDGRHRNPDRLASMNHAYGSTWRMQGYLSVITDMYRDTYFMTVVLAIFILIIVVMIMKKDRY